MQQMKLLGATVALLLVPSVAFADDTKMRIMEVQLGGTVHADSQFVEMVDPGEDFPEVYMFVTYDASGASVAAQSLPLSRGTTRVVMVNSSAQDEYKLKPGTTDSVSIVNLQTTLPPVGSVCFRRQDGGQTKGAASDQSGTRIHCMGWGAASAFPVSIGGTEHGDAPPPGLSLHKLAGCLQVDPPSPNKVGKQACELRTDKPIPMPATAPVDAAPAGDQAPAADDEPVIAQHPKENPPPTPETTRPPEKRADPNPDNTQNALTKKKGCSASGDGSWFGVVSLAGLAIVTRRRSSKKRS